MAKVGQKPNKYYKYMRWWLLFSEYIQPAVLLGAKSKFDICQIQIEYDKYKTYAKQEIYVCL